LKKHREVTRNMMKRSITARTIAAVVVAFICADTAFHPDAANTARHLLYVVFACAGLTGIITLVRLRQDFDVPRKPVRIQVVLDVVMVTVLVYFTGGISSMVTLLYVIVVLETGILLSRFDGIVVATLSSIAVMAMLALDQSGTYWPRPATVPYTTPDVGRWIDALIYVFAFYLTAFISGYWSFKLRRMLDFQRGLLNYLSSGFLIVDEDGIIRTFNVAAQKMLGYSLPLAMNRPSGEVLRTADGTDNPVEITLRTGHEMASHEFRGRRVDGSELPLGITTSVIRDRRGQVEGVIASFADMTALESARRELQQSDQLAAIGRLAAGLAHEIRNPVASIRGAIEELKGRLDDPETVHALSEIAIRESDQLNAIVTGFLDYARRAPGEIQPVNLRDVLEDVVSLLRRDCTERHHIELVSETEGDVTLEADYSHLKQAFLNVGKNALEAMTDGGTLRINFDLDNMKRAAITFSDSGNGISCDDMATIFEPFFTTKDHGVGIGMAVVHRIVTSHNGTIHVESEPGRGTKVNITFPPGAPAESYVEPVEEIALNARAASACS
jgi:two-component system sensor histidine kinase PilS (NtrC family)